MWEKIRINRTGPVPALFVFAFIRSADWSSCYMIAPLLRFKDTAIIKYLIFQPNFQIIVVNILQFFNVHKIFGE